MRQYLNIIDDLLSEARRNPEVNKKESALVLLSKYAGRDVYVTFTHDVGSKTHSRTGNYSTHRRGKESSVHNVAGAKIGINPSTNYSTPVGIYSYPIQYVLDKDKRVPFAGDRPYLWVFEPAGRMLDFGDYSDADLEADLKNYQSTITATQISYQEPCVMPPYKHREEKYGM